MKALLIGILSSMFFAVTFILNRSMEVSGGSWLWSSSLRFIFMVPFLVLIVWMRGNLRGLLSEMKKQPLEWIRWSVVGFVLFYAPLTYAAAYGPGWLVAGTWQFTIVAGLLLTPLFLKSDGSRHSVQFRSLFISCIILAGVVLIQVQQADHLSPSALLIGALPVVIAAFCYPLGNRKMMELCGDRLDTFQRILGMTLASLPAWLILSGIGFVQTGPPSSGQIIQTFIVAVSSGIIATALFFIATNSVRHDQGRLAAVEATQATQVLFVIAGEAVLLSSPLPSGIASVGIGLIVVGIVVHTMNMRVAGRRMVAVKSG
ncbi:DMT family transporter [Jeotgalibacillus salarius]|uniref:Multidrug resistance efflux transporter family protein n=1 Tax=Jeotgalibacillus salarius TaxID=546023 RepID=A0A4Y8LLZ4_9BACL|nr:multidrug resistance efflux transporter family protein [Jeotgalibacillus salarius]TFE02277.1 multidrug resistance efflux transporter family protein [Jeotgalibacillus salarius]